MNYHGFTKKTLLEWHEDIKRCMKIDDETTSGDKPYNVREYPDWRNHANCIEAELDNRKIQYEKINWMNLST